MKKILLSALIALASTSALAKAQWTYIVCNGYDSAGKPASLTAYSDSNYVTINGDLLKITGKTRDGRGVVTEEFTTTSGKRVYDSIVPYSNTGLNLYQFNAITDALLARADLECKFYGAKGSKHSVKDLPFIK